MLNKIVSWLEQWVVPASRIANYVGISMIVVLTLLTATNVLMRFFLGTAFTPMKELSEYALCVLVFLTLPLCAVKGAHIVVDVVTMRLTSRNQAKLASGIILLSIIICGLFTWQVFVRAVRAMNGGEESTILGVWLFPFVFIAGIGFLLLTLVYLIQWLRVLEDMRK
jgi:TRAP-type C4-dicarboxylate transport system permease small subunit